MEYIKSCTKLLCNAAGVGGEKQVSHQAIELLKAYTDDIVVDALGNVVATIQSDAPSAPIVLLEAHMDEMIDICRAAANKVRLAARDADVNPNA